MTYEPKRLPPFINDQVVFRLTAPSHQQHEWLGLKFTWRRWLKREGRNQPESEHFTDKHAWEEVADRWQLYADPNIRLLCVVDDAGMGKSISLAQIQYARQHHSSSHLAIHCEFHELPQDWRGYLGHHPGTGTQEFLLSKLMHGCGVKADQSSDIAALNQLLNAKLCQGQLTLFVDAFDQSNRHEHPEQAASSLAAFLKSEPRLRCVVSGRPFAIAHYWETLFSKCGSRPEDQWELVQLAEFTKDQAYRFVGHERAEKLMQIDAEVLATPRDLETILSLDADELDGVRTSSDVYWRCFEKALIRGVSDQLVRMSAPVALKLFSLLAFETVKRGLYAGVTAEGRKSGLDESAFDLLINELVETRETLTTIIKRSGGTIDSLLGQLGALNLALDPGIVSVDADTDPNNPVLRQLYWRNRTLQDFLAAVWLLKFSSAEDRNWLKPQKYVQGDGNKSQENAHLRQLWKFVCEMPAEAQTSERAGFVDLATSLLLPSDHPEYTVRSTEMIWRCWPGMLQAAGLLTLSQRNERDMGPATQALLKEGRRIVESGGTLLAAGTTAKASLLQFVGEYHRIRRNQHNKLGTEEARTADTFESGFRMCPPGPDESLETWFGNGGVLSTLDSFDNPIVISLGHRFQMHRTPLTSSEYSLFDAAHEARFGGYLIFSGKVGCPVINVNWYDAWVVGTWLSGQLPSEFQWEYACRAAPGGNAPRTEYYFGNERERLKDFAWYIENSDYKTHEVLPKEESERKQPNAWGLFHMHGNVWEWCSNLWADSARDSLALGYASSSRCLRGGSFVNYPGSCRSASRNGRDPSNSLHDIGVRLSRAASD